MSYTEFMNLVLPSTDATLKTGTINRNFVPSYSIQIDVEAALVRVLMKELEGIRQMEWARRDLAAKYDFNVQRAFRTIDANNSGFITNLEMKTFIEKYNNAPLSEEVNAILRKLDKDGDNMVNYNEFVEGVCPEEFSTLRQ